MALLLSAQSIAKAYGASPLFADLSLGIHDGDRVGLVGPNGSGKSTLLRVLAGIEEPDRGAVTTRRLARSAWVAQHPSFAAGSSVRRVIDAALASDAGDETQRETRVAAMLSRLGFRDPDAAVHELSGGWQKRVALAAALVAEPDLLLLDEPTNHLDLDGILWLEELLASRDGACVVVSHDRWFLERVATRMFDLDPVHDGGFFETRGRYSDFLERKDNALREQERWQETLANRVRREVEWLRRGPKARSTKSRSRIDEAARLQEDLSQVSARLARRELSLPVNASQRRTRRLLACEHLGKDFGERRIIDDANLVLSPGTRVGLLGPNGSGKSTLIRMLTGQLEPDRGRIERADDLRIALLDQHRSAIDPEVTLRRALAPAGDQVVFAGRPIHVAAWAKRFLFRSEQLSVPVGKLSGGEQARVLLAGLMLEPADVLVLDEPTNDLDIPTLEVLEESLIEFPGAVLLVTHDRYLFQRVTTTVLAFDGNGGVTPCADYEQWESERLRTQPTEAREPETAKPRSAGAAAATRPKKLGYLEQRELEDIEARILSAEETQSLALARANDPAIVADAGEVAERYRELERAQGEVERLYARWAELEEKRHASS